MVWASKTKNSKLESTSYKNLANHISNHFEGRKTGTSKFSK
jgi:hypothetical protein